jgi:hypothetical protein
MAMMDRAAYDRYVAVFNARDYDAVCDFYADPPTMSFFGVDIRSRDDMKRFYSFLHGHVRESITVENFAASDTLVAVIAHVRIEAFRDLDADTLAANGCGGLFPIAAGDVQTLRQFLLYHVKDGRIERVECAMPSA